ncbi:MAG: hypothetical protein ACR652_18290 [Methylocystis sp.]|uniref:hypothetical protein n=1 Tax=Methylocystis sp. TaxID=1911079 RepID=UPI003DA28706
MKRKEFGRLIDTIFAANAGEELSCSDYFERLPRYAELEVAGEDAAARLPEVRHFFEGVNMEYQLAKQKSFLTMAFGGPISIRAKTCERRTRDLSPRI